MAIRRVGIDEALERVGAPGVGVREVHALAGGRHVDLREAASGVENLDALALAKALSVSSGLPVVETVNAELIEPHLIRPIPLNLARQYGVLPLYVAEGQIIVGMADLKATRVLDDIRVLLGQPLRPVLVPHDVLETAMRKAYDKARATVTDVLGEVDDDGDVDTGDEGDDLMIDDESEATIIRFVNGVISEAIKERASDIHIEPFEKDLLVRYRIDGVLVNKHNPPFSLKDSIVARIKIMSGLNIAERRLPQDGRIRRRMAGREIDLRVSTVPVRHGERVVMRILEKGEVFSLGRIGMDPAVLEDWRQRIKKPNGILLVCGPTGSGKSSTLFSSLAEINTPDLNILTIEDPIEYELKGLGQVQVNPKINLTFASALRAFLRQDPDVILVGEIRDQETASNAVQASLTGHLVLSTIHTNDAAGAFTRLIDMGVEPFLVSDQLLGVLAQRLVRRLCPECKVEAVPTDIQLQELRLTRAEVAGRTIFDPVGCDHCNGLGYRGRCGIFEFMAASDRVKAAVSVGGSSIHIKEAAIAEGMRTLRDDGIEKMFKGITSADEVTRMTHENAED